jgi:hypothetical protein
MGGGGLLHVFRRINKVHDTSTRRNLGWTPFFASRFPSMKLVQPPLENCTWAPWGRPFPGRSTRRRSLCIFAKDSSIETMISRLGIWEGSRAPMYLSTGPLQ